MFITVERRDFSHVCETNTKFFLWFLRDRKTFQRLPSFCINTKCRIRACTFRKYNMVCYKYIYASYHFFVIRYCLEIILIRYVMITYEMNMEMHTKSHIRAYEDVKAEKRKTILIISLH